MFIKSSIFKRLLKCAYKTTGFDIGLDMKGN